MRAMVFAAGLGSRLRPLTDDRPKALVEIDGRTMLELTLARLRSFGIREVVINTHHFAEKLIQYLNAHDNFGMQIKISPEETLLDTGGGLKKATPLFAEFLSASSAESDDMILLHNVDVLSAIDLARLAQAHHSNQALATLAVQHRDTSRYLLFDEHRQLCGRRIGRDATADFVRPAQRTQALAFSGIHMISSHLLSKLTEDGVFSIINSYLRLAGQGERILGFRVDEYYWRDLGRKDDLELAVQDLKKNDLKEKILSL
jgi:NDP-sugar pyrophosphorylase family protein